MKKKILMFIFMLLLVSALVLGGIYIARHWTEIKELIGISDGTKSELPEGPVDTDPDIDDDPYDSVDDIIIVDLPIDLVFSGSGLKSIMLDDNNFIVYPDNNAQKRSFYFYNNNEGTLSYVDEFTGRVASGFKNVKDGFIYKNGSDLKKYSVVEKTSTLICENFGSLEYIDYNNGFFVISNKSYFYNFANDSFTLLSDGNNLSFSNSTTSFDFDGYLFYIASNRLHCINKLTMSVVIFEETFKSVSGFSIISFNNEFLLITSNNNDLKGVYKINLSSMTLDLVDDTSTNAYYYGSTVVNNILIVALKDGLYSYVDGDFSKLLEVTISSSLKITVIYSSDDYCLFSTNSSLVAGIYKYDFLENDCTQVYSKAYNWVNSYVLADNLFIGASTTSSSYYDLLIFNLEDYSVTEFYKSNGSKISSFVEYGDYVFIGGIDIFIIVDKLSLEIVFVDTFDSENLSLYLVNDNYCILTSDSSLIVIDMLNLSSVNCCYDIDIDSEKSDFDNKEFFGYFMSLSEGEMYYKYVINDDLTISKSLVLFNK